MALVVVGSVALDDVYTETEQRTGILGGSASYFSMGASVLTDVKVVAVVGDDFPDEYVELYRTRNVDTEGLVKKTGKTFHWAGRYSADFSTRTTLATDLNVFAEFDPKLPNSYRTASHVFLGNIEPGLQHKVLDQLESPLFVAADTMNYWIDHSFDRLMALLPRLDMLLINDEEARLLGRSSSLTAAAKKILALGPKSIVVKRGEHGASLYHEKGSFFLPAFPVKQVADPTGAGDSFASGFMGYLAGRVPGTPSFEDLKQALAVGTAVASFTVEHFSLDGLLHLDANKILERYQTLLDLVHIDPITTL